jgi:uncharacterized protein HemX
MEQQVPQQAPEQETPAAAPQPEAPEEHMGGGSALIALGVIVVIILAGAFFIFGDKYVGAPKTEADLEEQFDASEQQAGAELEAIIETSDSNALADIEADLNGSDLSDLDGELDAIDQEFGS